MFIESTDCRLNATHFTIVVDELVHAGLQGMAEEFFLEGRRQTGFERMYPPADPTMVDLTRASLPCARFAIEYLGRDLEAEKFPSREATLKTSSYGMPSGVEKSSDAETEEAYPKVTEQEVDDLLSARGLQWKTSE